MSGLVVDLSGGKLIVITPVHPRDDGVRHGLTSHCRRERREKDKTMRVMVSDKVRLDTGKLHPHFYRKIVPSRTSHRS